jgi:hypothetical protein
MGRRSARKRWRAAGLRRGVLERAVLDGALLSNEVVEPGHFVEKPVDECDACGRRKAVSEGGKKEGRRKAHRRRRGRCGKERWVSDEQGKCS